MTSPARENKRSLATDVAETDSSHHANSAMTGYEVRFVFHHWSGHAQWVHRLCEDSTRVARTPVSASTSQWLLHHGPTCPKSLVLNLMMTVVHLSALRQLVAAQQQCPASHVEEQLMSLSVVGVEGHELETRVNDCCYT